MNEENQASEEDEMNKPSCSTIEEVILDENVLNELRKTMGDEFTEVLQLYL